MIEKFLIFLSILCALFTFNRVQCAAEKNTGILLECFPYQRFNFIKFNIDMHLSTKSKEDQLLPRNPILTEEVDFDPTRKTAVIVHGLGGNPRNREMINLKNELRTMDNNMNVIALGWQDGCSNPLQYPQAVVNTRNAAVHLARVISNTADYWKTKGVEPEDWAPVHFIGHSLGAHVVGQAARYLHVDKHLDIDRVTALDPAEPCFENATFWLRIHKTDAKFVDVIHTDSAIGGRNSAFGLYEPIGHVDFYPNGGRYQPGCFPPIVRRKRALNIAGLIRHIFVEGACSHARALTLFTESVKQKRLNGCKFWARSWQPGPKPIPKNIPCNEETCQQLGINAKLPAANEISTYYVTTTDAAPFCNV